MRRRVWQHRVVILTELQEAETLHADKCSSAKGGGSHMHELVVLLAVLTNASRHGYSRKTTDPN